MAARKPTAPCSVCKQTLSAGKASRVVVEQRTMIMCRAHAAVVAANMPRTFEELRDLFREPTADGQPGRRSLIERRLADDRRVFPPRPEGRRMSPGRRASDDPG